MTKISEAEFARICEGIYADRETIFHHNPIGTRDEVLLWMLLSCLNSYLSLTELETPCFTGVPSENTYQGCDPVHSSASGERVILVSAITWIN